jgi:hypothetical protein
MLQALSNLSDLRCRKPKSAKAINLQTKTPHRQLADCPHPHHALYVFNCA